MGLEKRRAELEQTLNDSLDEVQTDIASAEAAMKSAAETVSAQGRVLKALQREKEQIEEMLSFLGGIAQGRGGPPLA